MNLYRVAKRPDDFKGMLAYILTGTAGEGVVIGQDWFHFRRGFFVRDRAKILLRKSGYFLSQAGEATERDMEHFNRAVGLPWGLRHNCLTTVTAYLAKRVCHGRKQTGCGNA